MATGPLFRAIQPIEINCIISEVKTVNGIGPTRQLDMELLLYTPLGETHIKDDSYYIQNDVAYVC